MKKLLVTTVIALSLGGCSMFAPSAKSQFSVEPGTPTETVFLCAESTINSLKVNQGNWGDTVTARDKAIGLFETDNFKETNVIGIRSQVKYKLDTGEGRVRVKASGPYFIDLGADKAAMQLADGIRKCL